MFPSTNTQPSNNTNTTNTGASGSGASSSAGPEEANASASGVVGNNEEEYARLCRQTREFDRQQADERRMRLMQQHNTVASGDEQFSSISRTVAPSPPPSRGQYASHFHQPEFVSTMPPPISSVQQQQRRRVLCETHGTTCFQSVVT